MTDRSEIEVRVKKVLAEQLAVDEAQVVPDARFAEDLNADSLDLVEAVLALEEEWSIEIPEEEMESREDGRPGRRPGGRQAGRLLRQRATPTGTPVSQRRKVVITGIGPVTPVGTGVDDFWEGLTTGRNGVADDHRVRPLRPAGLGGGRCPALRRHRPPRREGGAPDRPLRPVRDRVREARVGRCRRARGPLRTRRGDLRHRHRRRADAAEPARRAAREGRRAGVAVHGADADGQRRRRSHRHELRPHRPQLLHGLGLLVVATTRSARRCA